MNNYRRVVPTTHRLSRTSTAPAKFVANSLPKPLDMLFVYPCQTTICTFSQQRKRKNDLEGKTNPSLLLELRQPNRKVFASCYLAAPSTPSPVCHCPQPHPESSTHPANASIKFYRLHPGFRYPRHKYTRKVQTTNFFPPFTISSCESTSRDGEKKAQPHRSSEGRAASPLGCQE